MKVRGRWMYLYRAIHSLGDTVEFLFSEHRDLSAAKRFLRKALQRHGRPDRIVIDGSQTNREAIIACDGESRLRNRLRRSLKPIRIRHSQYLTDVFDKDLSALVSWKCALRAFCSGGRQKTASRAARSRLAGRPSRGMRGLALTERARRYRSPLRDGTAKLNLLLCRGSGDRVAKSRVEVATLSRSL